MNTAFDAIIIGGGIAGTSLAWRLAHHGGMCPVVLEQEPVLASHSSGRNAAIWLPTDDDSTTPGLARRSAAMLDVLTDGRWLTPHGAIMVARHPETLESSIRGAKACGCRAERIGPERAATILPVLAGGDFVDALWVEGAGTLDIHGMTSAVAAAARTAGALLRPRARVERILVGAGRVRGCELADGQVLESPVVVNAAGAWASELGQACGAPLPIAPFRRHLVQLETDESLTHATVWHVEDEVYFRRESTGVLASPCDETPHPPGLPATDTAMLDVLERKLSALAPPFAHARVRSAWACLRTFASDRELVCGQDPRIEGLWWMAGFGGRGMTVGVGAADLMANLIAGEEEELASTVAPDRLLASLPPSPCNWPQ